MFNKFLIDKGSKMKKIIISLVVFIFAAIGCSDQTSLISPEDPTSTLKNLKLVELPKPHGSLSVASTITRQKYINGNNGGSFIEEFVFQSISGDVTILSALVFPPNSFNNGKTITQTFNTETASLEFGPAMFFNIPVTYTLTVSGLDLSGLNPETLHFVYIAQDGTLTGVQYDSISINYGANSITVTNAQLNHFSRYGFVN